MMQSEVEQIMDILLSKQEEAVVAELSRMESELTLEDFIDPEEEEA